MRTSVNSNTPFGTNVTRKTIVFNGSAAATRTLFTISGFVCVDFFVRCTASCGSVDLIPNICLGITGTTNYFIADTDVNTLTTNELWYDTSPTTTIDLTGTALFDYVLSNTAIVLDEKGIIASGTLEFICFWTPLSFGASVT